MYYIVIYYVISESAQRHGRCSGTFLSWQKSALRRDQNDCCACAKHPSAKLERWKPGGYLPVSHYISLYISLYTIILYNKIILRYQFASVRLIQLLPCRPRGRVGEALHPCNGQLMCFPGFDHHHLGSQPSSSVYSRTVQETEHR